MGISTKQYGELREALVSQLQKVEAAWDTLQTEHQDLLLDELAEKRAELTLVRQRVYANQFTFVLVAQSQGGKSTTFNAMVGGSPISPMGNAALKCSAAPLSVHNVDDAADVGAHVYLRTHAELSDICRELTGSPVDFHNTESIRAARDAHASAFLRWQKNKGDISDEQRDLLFLVGLILHFHSSAQLQALRSEAAASPTGTIRISVEEVGALVSFPPKFQQRYATGEPTQFDPSEVLFPFIRRVVCRVQSPHLRRIGASVTDAPGLFANNTDTRAAFAEINNSDAVWYLLEAKQISQADRRAIRDCKAVCGNRIFFSANIKDNQLPRDALVEEVFPAIAAQLSETGIEASRSDLRPYHALLALLSQQGAALLNGTADSTIRAFLQQRGSARFRAVTPEDGWAALAADCLYRLQPEAEREFRSLPTPLSQDGIAILARESGFDSILAAMEQHVLAQKAASILVDNGSARASTLLQLVERKLKNREDNAGKDETAQRALYDRSAETLRSFIEFVDTHALPPLLGDQGDVIDGLLARDVFERVIVAHVDDIAEQAAGPLREHLRPMAVLESLIDNFGVDKLQSQCRSVIETRFDSVITPAIAAWSSEVADGRNEVFNTKIAKTAQYIIDSIHRQWQAQIGGDQLLKTLPPPPTSLASLSSKDLARDVVERVDPLWISLSNALQIVATMIASIVSGLAQDWRTLFQRMDDTIKDEIRVRLADELRSSLQAQQFKAVDTIKAQVSEYRASVVAAIRKPIDERRQAFESDRAQAEQDWKLSLAKQQAIAEESNRVRTQSIEPLRRSLDSFAERVRAACSEPHNG